MYYNKREGGCQVKRLFFFGVVDFFEILMYNIKLKYVSREVTQRR